MAIETRLDEDKVKGIMSRACLIGLLGTVQGSLRNKEKREIAYQAASLCKMQIEKEKVPINECMALLEGEKPFHIEFNLGPIGTGYFIDRNGKNNGCYSTSTRLFRDKDLPYDATANLMAG